MILLTFIPSSFLEDHFKNISSDKYLLIYCRILEKNKQQKTSLHSNQNKFWENYIPKSQVHS
jgi:hypothetical protein